MQLDVVLGLQWGDEGKGKIVDVLANDYPVVARFQGGPNAGHSIHFEGKKFVLHTIPSGVFREGSINFIGNGVVIDPIIFREECLAIEAMGVPVRERVVIADRAHLILPTHRIIDAASEQAKGKGKIGSTLKGIGPAYMDKTGRNGLRVGDILTPDFRERYQYLKNKHIICLRQFDYRYDALENERKWLDAIEYMKQFEIVDGAYRMNKYLSEGKSVLAEGAQGTMLDVDFGSYPFVTSSSTACAGACIGLGVSPHTIGKVYGVFKAYCTRVGSGPFPTELLNETGEELRQKGFEFGATTGRPRRTGWLDLPALKYAVMVDGVDELIMMKADVLDEFDTIRVAVAYMIDGRETNEIPYDVFATVEPVYKEFKGWKCNLAGIKREKDMPSEFKEYIKFIEDYLKVPVKIISLGPDRDQTVKR